MAYYLLYFYSFLFTISLNFISNNKIKKLLFTVLFFMFALFSGFRSNVGIDFIAYEELFQSINLGSNDIYFEVLNIYIAKLFYFLGFDTQFLFLFYSSLTIFFFIKYIKYFSSNYYLSFLIFISFGMFYLASFNQVRQYLALAIFLFSLKYIWDKDFLKYSLLIVTASLIHLSALVLLPVYFILNKKASNISYILVACLYIFVLNFLELILSYTPYAFYLNTTIFEREISSFLLYLFIFINSVFLIFRHRIVKIFPSANIFFNMAFISTLLILSTIFSNLPSMIFIRINNYFIPYLIIIPALYFTTLKNKNLKIIYIFSISIVSFIYFFYTIEANGIKYNLVPYKFNLKIF